MTSYPKDKINILLLENINTEALHIFKESGYTNITHLKSSLSEDELIKQIADAHIIGIRSKTQLTKRILDSAPRLLAIGCFCIGTNQVDIADARRKGIVVFNAPYSNTRSVAELVIGAAIMLIRRIPEKNRLAHDGVWAKDASNSHELRGKTLGIIGYGNIGSQVSVMAEAMGMKVIYFDTQKKLPLGNAHAAAGLADLLQQSDIVSIHTPANAATRNLINAVALKECKGGAIFINYARGEVVDIEALKDALTEGKLSGAAVDVYPEEPVKNSDPFITPLQHIPNVLLTPHIAGSTEEAQANIGTDVSTRLVQFIETGTTSGSHTVPELTLPVQEDTNRILHIHRNVPGVLSEINAALSASGINILAQYLKTNEDIGYVVLDIKREGSKDAADLLRNVKETIKVRMLY
ncbi:MAG: phosphoglycerate dehydrogenase [Flavipsychrobacter sp.]|nr:phosphoglycerate dehydrogenase [Flavipsychrobacter sp.]